jgi:V/A-type H+-transporting ATPase subunit C
MRSRLLGRQRYTELMATGSIDRLLGALHDTPYRPDVEAAIARFEGLRRLDEAVRTNLGRTLRAMRSFYQGEPGERVELLVRRWDLANVRDVIRGRALVAATEDILPRLVPAGRLSDAELAELAAQRSVRSVIDLMVAWGVPTRRSARALLAVVSDYEVTGDVAVLEHALYRTWAASLEEELADVEPGDPLAATLRAEIGMVNLLTAFRLREARLAGEPETKTLEAHLLPGGRVPLALLEAVWLADDRAEAAAASTGTLLPPGWSSALEGWAESGDVQGLGSRLEAAVTGAAVALFATGDPLGIAVPVAYTFAKENEARNLRLIARGLVHGLSPGDVAERLVVAA